MSVVAIHSTPLQMCEALFAFFCVFVADRGIFVVMINCKLEMT